MATVPSIAALAKKARDAKVPVIYSSTSNPAGPPPMVDEVKPQAGEPTVATRANKFVDTNLAELLKQRNAKTLVIVGSASNGAVLYTSFHATIWALRWWPKTEFPVPDPSVICDPCYQLLQELRVLPMPPTSRLAEKAVTLEQGRVDHVQIVAGPLRPGDLGPWNQTWP